MLNLKFSLEKKLGFIDDEPEFLVSLKIVFLKIPVY
jgi:hypothetical protein